MMSTSKSQSHNQSNSQDQVQTKVYQKMMNQSANVEQLLNMVQDLIAIQTSKPTLKEKLKSRKFWLAVALMIAGICGMVGCNDNTTAIIVFAVLEIVAVVGYWISEGGLDKTRAQELTSSIITLVEIIGGMADAKTEAQDAIEEAKKESEIEETEVSKTE